MFIGTYLFGSSLEQQLIVCCVLDGRHPNSLHAEKSCMKRETDKGRRAERPPRFRERQECP
jgi:hypothetical protein